MRNHFNWFCVVTPMYIAGVIAPDMPFVVGVLMCAFACLISELAYDKLKK